MKWSFASGVIVLLACTSDEAPSTSFQTPELIATVSGFETPESVRWDSARSVFHVSNVTGNRQQTTASSVVQVLTRKVSAA